MQFYLWQSYSSGDAYMQYLSANAANDNVVL